ncbi:MAG: cyclase family protein [Candidatus Cloacimonetes bacterium]|nr:cyclase family protein [Candidatus Cloacimonadota bacterium]
MIRLSWTLNEKTPAYGNGDSLSLKTVKCMHAGDSCNTLQLSLSNHLGTHIDLPFHFDPKGQTLNDYPNDFFYFKNVQLETITKEDGELICKKDLQSIQADKDCEILLINTGWAKKRHLKSYMMSPPGVHENCADYLRDSFPKLRVLGFDFISLSSFTNRTMGRKSHKAFLAHQRPICILEDMDLRDVKEIDNLLISPLMIDYADGTPVTVWANI